MLESFSYAQTIAEGLRDPELFSLLRDYEDSAIELDDPFAMPENGGKDLPNDSFFAVHLPVHFRDLVRSHPFWKGFTIVPGAMGCFIVNYKVFIDFSISRESPARRGANFLHELVHVQGARKRDYRRQSAHEKTEEETEARRTQIKMLKLFPAYQAVRPQLLRRAEKRVSIGRYLTIPMMYELVSGIDLLSLFDTGMNAGIEYAAAQRTLDEVFTDLNFALARRERDRRGRTGYNFIKWLEDHPPTSD